MNPPLEYTEHLGPYAGAAQKARNALRANNIVQRIWNHDHTVWQPSPNEISNRLGWLHAPQTTLTEVPRLRSFTDAVRKAGFTHAVLLGMGGSSLAPEVFEKVFGTKCGYLRLTVLDTTDPAAVLAVDAKLDYATTLFVVSSKSGGTVETLSLFKYFYNRTAKVLGVAQKSERPNVGAHFVAITDLGSGLEQTARALCFRDVFLNDPNLGGRYSALTLFGLLPAALIGVDVEKLLKRADALAQGSRTLDQRDLCAQSGTTLAALAQVGRNKVTIVGSDRLTPIGPWVEQLVAESTGKRGVGILPIVSEVLGHPNAYGDDRLFVHLGLENELGDTAHIHALTRAGHPTVHVALSDVYDLGAEMFRWEMATAIASHFLQVNPFDQPNVESAKVLSREMVRAYQTQGRLPRAAPCWSGDGLDVFADVAGNSLKTLLENFFAQTQPGDYIAIQAFVPPTADTTQILQQWRTLLRDRCRVATTLGYGPRFLHSTGQLHKGDGGQGLFVQITCEDAKDVAIPREAGRDESGISFGTLKAAQAMGDRQALLDAGRRVIGIHCRTSVSGAIQHFIELLGSR